MSIVRTARALVALAALTPPATALSQYPDHAALLKAQREAMGALAAVDGVWRGPAWTLEPNGQKRHLTQTERIGPFLEGTLKVIEGRGYDEDGRVAFNAFGIVSFDPAKKTYQLRAYARGYAGDFPFEPRPDGYAWQAPAGPGATVRYVATIRDGTLHQVGDRIVEGRPPVRVFEMTLKRIGDTSWPAGGAVPRN